MRTATASRTPRTPQAGQDALGASDISEVMSLAEAATIVPGKRRGGRGVHPMTLLRWSKNGVLRTWTSPNGLIVTTRAALLAAMGVPQAAPGGDALGASDISEVFSLAEAARLVPGKRRGGRGVHPMTLFRWSKNGVLRTWTSPNGLIVTTRAALLAAMGVPRSAAAAAVKSEAVDKRPKSAAELDDGLDAVLGKKKAFTQRHPPGGEHREAKAEMGMGSRHRAAGRRPQAASRKPIGGAA